MPVMPKCCTWCEEGFSADKKFCGLCGRPTVDAECTDFEVRCDVLAELFIEYKDDERFTALFSYADLGLPLAYACANGIVAHTDRLAVFVNETWDALLEGLGETYDAGYENLADLLGEE